MTVAQDLYTSIIYPRCTENAEKLLDATHFFIPIYLYNDLEFGTADSLVETLLSFLKVDDRPNGVKILADYQLKNLKTRRKTYIDLDIAVLEIESMLPDIDT